MTVSIARLITVDFRVLQFNAPTTGPNYRWEHPCFPVAAAPAGRLTRKIDFRPFEVGIYESRGALLMRLLVDLLLQKESQKHFVSIRFTSTQVLDAPELVNDFYLNLVRSFPDHPASELVAVRSRELSCLKLCCR